MLCFSIKIEACLNNLRLFFAFYALKVRKLRKIPKDGKLNVHYKYFIQIKKKNSHIRISNYVSVTKHI